MNKLQSAFELGMRIQEYTEKSPTSDTKTSFKEIEELKSFDWVTLNSEMNLGTYELRTFAPAPASFNIVATAEHKRIYKMYKVLTFAALIIPIVLAFLFSFWWLVLLILVPIFKGSYKATYNDAIFSSALCSEEGFSFLFSRGAILLSGQNGLIFSKTE